MSLCIALAREASEIETKAMEADRESRRTEAARLYRMAGMKLRESAKACPLEFPMDAEILAQHADEVLFRADYLDCLRESEAAQPLESHIHGLQLALGSSHSSDLTPVLVELSLPPDELASLRAYMAKEHAPPSAQLMFSASAISGVAGLLLLGPMSAAALGVAAAYVVTREDGSGKAARSVGAVGIKVVQKARHLDGVYKLSDRVLGLGHSAMGHAMAIGSNAGLTDQALAISSFNERHKVSDRLCRGLSTAGTAFYTLMSRPSR